MPIWEDLLGMKIDGYTVKKMVEIYSITDDGFKNKAFAFMENPDSATAWAEQKSSDCGPP